MLIAPPPPPARIVAPTAPTPVARQPFPMVATVAPVLMSVVLWMVTQSVFSLVFAALGPVIAIASLIDSRRGGRRRVAAEAARFDRELEQARAEIEQEHERERAQLRAAAPSARQLIDGPQHVHWGSDGSVLLVLGATDRPSAVQFDTRDARGDDPASLAVRQLRASAAVLRDAPLLIAADRGLGVVGPSAQCAAFLRGVVVQLLAAISPADPGEVMGDEAWLTAVPHGTSPGPAVVGGVQLRCAAEVAAITGVDTVVRLSGSQAEIVRGTGSGTAFRPEYLSLEQAALWAAAASRAAERMGIGTAQLSVGSFAQLPTAEGMLGSVIGSSAQGPMAIDLATDGPHAIVGGTTGSGKSELLVTWLLGMAAAHSPAEVTMLLVDFKGGTSFGALPTLPHCVGLVTDLDAAGATRALSSLAAELRHRERVIAEAGVRSIEELTELPRLVIAVDEFAAMAAELPELHALFSDIAARGRSLGVHLVLCTQRPAGVVRDSLLANASLRISLRVNNRADSSAVLGSDVAALGRPEPGRAWVARGSVEPQQVQVALATRDDIARVAQRWGSGWAPRRPWLDPLPAQLLPDHARGAIALLDLPGEQAQRALDWHPSGGDLLVVGGGRSGKTAALRAIAKMHGGLIVDEVETAWDALTDPPPLLLIDDVDAIIATLAPDYQQAFVDRLATALRSSGSTVVVTAQRLGASLQQLTALCDHRLLLRMSSRQEHVIAGGSGETFDAALPPGAGWWQGNRLQLVRVDAVAAAVAPPRTAVAARNVGLAVSPRPQALAARLSAMGMGHVTVTDPESWLADWGRFGALARETAVLFHECSPSEFRQLSRRRSLPPPISDVRRTGWLLDPEAEPVRVTLEDD